MKVEEKEEKTVSEIYDSEISETRFTISRIDERAAWSRR